MRQRVSKVEVVLILAVIALGGEQTLPRVPAYSSTYPAVIRLSEDAVPNQMPTASTWDATQRSVRLKSAAPSAGGQERLGAPMSRSALILPAAGANPNDAPYQLSSAQTTTLEPSVISLAPATDHLRLQVLANATQAQVLSALSEATPRQTARCEPGLSQSAGLEVSAVLTYTYTQTVTPPTIGGDNYTGPSTPKATEPSVEVCITLTENPYVSFFADLTAKAPSDSPAIISIDRLYLDLRNTLGVPGLRFRIGRDRVRLGPLGLLLDEVLIDDGRRDGYEVWLPSIGSVRLFGFFQYALENRSTTRRVWGGRAESQVFTGWTLGVNYRADTAATADAGLCPGSPCATGSGLGVDLEGSIVPGLTLTQAYGMYLQTGDVARGYYAAELVLDLKDLAGIQRFEPVLTIWYKNFGPYTIPGADGSVPRGGFLTPDDFKLFNINDNLTAVGSRLELQLMSHLAFFALGEWGTYKAGGPTYNVYSAGLEFSFPDNIAVKFSYNAYTVAGGSVITSPVSGIELSNATVLQVEFKKSW